MRQRQLTCVHLAGPVGKPVHAKEPAECRVDHGRLGAARAHSRRRRSSFVAQLLRVLLAKRKPEKALLREQGQTARRATELACVPAARQSNGIVSR